LPVFGALAQVLAVPREFDDSQRQGLKDAATIAGLNVLRLVAEDHLACVAYGPEQPRARLSFRRFHTPISPLNFIRVSPYNM
jgi:hypothetical protein